jgi:hypothetical protein
VLLMKTKGLVLAVIMLLGVFAFIQFSPVMLRAQDAVTTCALPFEAVVRQGPSAGTALNGDLNFTVDATGELNGNLVLEDKSEVPVVGQVVGHAINMAFDVSTADTPTFIFGTGTAVSKIEGRSCGDWLGGPFVGPAKGDSGDWLAGAGKQ